MKWMLEYKTIIAHVLDDTGLGTLCGISAADTKLLSMLPGALSLLTKCSACRRKLRREAVNGNENAKRLWLETYNLEAGTG